MTKNAAAARADDSVERTTVAKNIGEAFILIMESVGYVQKTGHNKAQNYKYAGEAELIKVLRPQLIKHNVICIPSEAKSRTETIVVGDKKTFRTVIDYTFVYTHVPSNTNFQVQVIGEGVDTGDKAAYKAATGALKYALRQPFLIETGDEPEAHDLPEEKNHNSPTSGVTPQSEFGTAVAFKKYHADTMGFIEGMVAKDQAENIGKRIARVKKVDDQCAQELSEALDLKLDELHLHG